MQLYKIIKMFEFSASHQLTHLDPEHPCARLHGHNYRVYVTLVGPVEASTGFVYDYNDLGFVKKYIDEKFDHRHLNDVLGDSKATTAEALAHHFYLFVRSVIHDPKLVHSVAVCETPKTWAEYPGDA